jgi:hypothetical protein
LLSKLAARGKLAADAMTYGAHAFALQRQYRRTRIADDVSVLTVGLVHDWSILAFIVLFPIAFGGLWCFVAWLLSHIGGWAKIAEIYPAVSRPDGIHCWGRNLQIRPFANYSGCMNVTVSPQGIFMIPFAPFRFGHRPLLIPWNCVGPLEEESFFVRFHFLSIEAAGKKMRLSLTGEAADWIRENRPAA